MIYITGDCHGDFSRFSTAAFPEQKKMTKDDYIIICGDFGIWHDTNEERYWLKWLNEKPFTTLFVAGNHENYDRLKSNEFEIKDWHGGKVHVIRDSILHLMNGYVFEICGKRIFAFGGAQSHDIRDGILDENDYDNHEDYLKTRSKWNKLNKEYRINHVSWWKEEIPSKEEMDFGLKTLEENKNQVDYIVTHCCPHRIEYKMSNGRFAPDALTEYFDVIDGTADFKYWFYGHYHNDMQYLEKYILLYMQFIKIA